LTRIRRGQIIEAFLKRVGPNLVPTLSFLKGSMDFNAANYSIQILPSKQESSTLEGRMAPIIQLLIAVLRE